MMLANQVFETIEKLTPEAVQNANSLAVPAQAPVIDLKALAAQEGIGRNDPCPCGSGKKWKNCGMQNTPEHRERMAQKAK
jgi:uncharacterized protein YecA (UPF0149 family)